MAESLNSTRRFVFKESQILVNVEHASDDLLVVSYPYKSKIFQGILLDSTNRYLPCAYPSPEVVKWSPPRVIDIKDPSAPAGEAAPVADRAFYSLSNRFTYFQDVLFQKNVALIKSAKQAKAKAQKMTVRLRPRQVLCSKCRSICNENSENVRSPGSAKKEEKPDKESSGNETQNDEVKNARKKVRTTLVPKLSRLEPEDIRALNGGQGEASRVWSEMLEADKQMVLRKKRSVGSMEDLWDETVFEEASKKAKTTPIIKISFGSPGEGTVLKIPSKVRLSGSEGEEEEDKGTAESSKSLKKAMKKAKKEAKRKISPEREEDPSPEEPNYKKHRHRVKHKKRHKNSKEDDMKDKCLKQKLSISLRRVCGPGEEESWSGESSRSSEPVKDIDDIKSDLIQDSLQELPSRVNAEDTQHFKETTKRVLTEPVETPKKNRRVGAQKRKKSDLTETVDKENPPDEILERLGNVVLKSGETSVSSSEILLRSNKSRQEPVRSIKFAQNPVPSKKGPDKNSKAKSSMSETSSSNTDKNNENKCSNTLIPKEENLSTTKDVSGGEELIKIVNEELKIPDSLIKTEGSQAKSDISVFPLNTDTAPNIADKKSVEMAFKIDDTLDDNLISEDSMPELDETIEDALLESDKEMPEVLENQRIDSLTDVWETEREIPILTRMVDPEEVTSSKIISSDSKSLPLKVEDILEKSKVMSELESENSQLKLSKDSDEDRIKIKIDKVSSSDQLSLMTEDCLSSNQSQIMENRLPLDEVVDSSEELEFLPAEDYFDDTLDGEIPLCPKDNTSTLLKSESTSFDADQVDVSKKCVRSPNHKTFEDCLSPKASLDFELGHFTSGSPKSSLETSLLEVKRLKSSLDSSNISVPLSLDIETRPITKHNEKGCEKEKPLNSSQDYSLQDSSSLDQSVFICSSSQLKRGSVPSDATKTSKLDSLSPFSSKFSHDTSLALEDDRSPECDSNSARDDQNKVEMVSSSRMSHLRGDDQPENLDHLCEKSMDIVSSFPESSVEATSLEVSSSETAPSKGSPASFHPDEGSDSMDTLSHDGCQDSVPNFPESSSLGAPQEVTSCQALDGSILNVGDIVWAKIHGFPWWPAKVTRLSAGGSGSSGCDARVAWFGSATSSLMSTDQLSPFIQTFKAKYNRERKSTGYLEAIRQATSEASSRDFHLPTPLAEIDELLAL